METQANVYTVMVASEDFLRGGYLDNGNLPVSSDSEETARNFRARIDRTASIEILSARDCMQAYSTQYVSARGDLLLVQNSPGTNYFPGADYYPDGDYSPGATQYYSSTSYSEIPTPPYFSLPTTYPSYYWVCPSGNRTICNPSPDLWNVTGSIVQYCWSEKTKENCKVCFSLYFAITVIICNFVKVISMFMTFKTHKHGALVTLGDGIESFLDKEDITTRGLGIYSTDRIQLLWNWDANKSQTLSDLTPSYEKLFLEMNSKQWKPKSWYWGSAATRKRWAICFAM